MSDFLSSDPDEFDRQLNDHFSGIGKWRTLLSGTWRNWINEECEGTGFGCLAAWDNGDGSICFAMQDPEKSEGVHLVYKEHVSHLHAVETFARIKYLFEHPRPVLLPSDFEAPTWFVSSHLYFELISMGFEGDALIAEYKRLGGESPGEDLR